MSLQKDIWKQVAVKYDENETERWMGKKDGNRRDQMTTFSFFDIRIESYISYEVYACSTCANATVIIISNINLILFHRKNSYVFTRHTHTHTNAHTSPKSEGGSTGVVCKKLTCAKNI